jgi:hypothetical protein
MAQRGSFGTITVPGNRIGAVVTGSLVIVAWLALPLARPFILGTGGLGLIVGLLLWRKHNRES